MNDPNLEITLVSDVAAALDLPGYGPAEAKALDQVETAARKGIAISRSFGCPDAYGWPLHISPILLLQMVEEIRAGRKA